MSSLCWLDPDEQRKSAAPRQKPQRLAQTGRGFSENPTSSIPTKYATVVFPRNDKKGFSSTSARFDDSQFLQSDAPGPGAYEPKDPSTVSAGVSNSKKGTGNFPSKVKRFPRPKVQQISPTSYNPDESIRRLDRKDFNQAPVSRTFHVDCLLPDHKSRKRFEPPPPNKYNVPAVPSRPLPAAASFKARSQRETFALPSAANPSPGQYNASIDSIRPEPKGHNNIFRSSVKRTVFKPPVLKTPGPGAYNNHVDVHVQRPAVTQTHYLCLSAPAIPPPRSPSPPGPTAYSLQERSSFTMPESRRRLDPSFQSSTGRWTSKMMEQSDPQIGPGTYNPTSPFKRSYFLNHSSKWI